MIGASRLRNVAPLAVGLVLLTVLLLGCRRWGQGLTTWATEELGALWASCGLLAYGTAAVLAVRSFPLLRDARLYALTMLLLPLGAVQWLRTSRAWEDVGAPWLGRAVEHLDPWVVVFAPAVVLAACAVPTALPVRTLRLVTAGLALLLTIVAMVLLLLGAPGPEDLSFGAALLTGVSVVAGATAFAVWRSDGGLGGAVAALCAGYLVAGLAQTGVGFEPVLRQVCLSTGLIAPDDVSLGQLTAGTDRLLHLVLPAWLMVVVAREWIVNLSHRTSIDVLTRLYNKDYAKSIVEQTGMCDLGSCFSVAVADIDFFKKVNDTHGHGAGDVVLHEVAAAIRETIGARGVVCRTGGEEITIFFPFLALAEASELCDRVRKRVEKHKIPIVNNDRRKLKITVTISVGVASNTSAEGEPAHAGVADVVQAADRAVYAAKKGGRNRVVTM